MPSPSRMTVTTDTGRKENFNSICHVYVCMYVCIYKCISI